MPRVPLFKDVILMKKIAFTSLLLLLAGLVLFAGCTQSPAPTTPVPTTAIVTPAPATPLPAAPTPMPDTVKVAANPQYGQILVDANGMTLYYFTKDTPGAATSACSTGACATLWPAFTPASLQVSAPLLGSDFDSIVGPGNTSQVTYMGWPLYYYSKDKAPGDTNGYGFNKLWYVMSPTGVVTLAPTTTVATTVPTTVPTPVNTYGGGGY